MDKWNNSEKNKIIDNAGKLIVEEGWNEAAPINALYHAHLSVLPEDCHVGRHDLIESSGRTEESLFKSLAAKVKKLRK